MADQENTTASEPTSQTAPDNTEAGSTTSSTTETSPNQQTSDEGSEPPAPTILTPAADPAAPPGDGEGEGDGEGKATADPAAQYHGAPEGDYELTGLPEDVTIDTDALAAISPVAKELNLSNEGLSKLAVAYNEMLPGVVQRVEGEIERQVAATHAQWAEETQKMVAEDPAFGGKKMGEVQQIAAKALDRLASPGFREFLAQSGLGNNPEMVKTMFMAGSAIAEDTTFERGGVAPTPKNRTEKYYGPAT